MRARSVVRFALLGACLAAAACGDAKSLVKVTVASDATVGGIDHLSVTVMNAGMSAGGINVPVPGKSIPPPVDFSLGFAADRKGAAMITIAAVDASGATLSTGAATAMLQSGAEVDVLVKLGGAQPGADMSGTPDDGGGDGALGDGGPPDAPADGLLPEPDATLPCEGSACNCKTVSDCPAGQSCDLTLHQCVGTCGSGHTACSGGCCDGTVCVTGTENGKCGTTGAACVACGGMTPACSAGACMNDCAVGMGGATCGAGFCCASTNQCVAIGNGACGLAGGSCTDCSKSTAGPLCLGGACGCKSESDCPAGHSCMGGMCSTKCDGASFCNGGCCDPASKSCVAGTASEACALPTGSAFCGTCADNAKGAACLVVNGKTVCGCSSTSDCPTARACDVKAATCTTACSTAQPCNGGCCTLANNGTCTPGTDGALCGNNGGLCAACAAGFNANLSGNTCVPSTKPKGGYCGCTDATQCPTSASGCDKTTGLCTFSCSMASPCFAGCCAGGACKPGTANTLCGPKGSACVDCTASGAGHVCLPATQTCGCNGASDCPVGRACNVATHQCDAGCNDGKHSPCNGGCCSGNLCVAGTGATACGSSGFTCGACAFGSYNRACIVGSPSHCGCNGPADCPGFLSCNLATHYCESYCGNGHSACSSGCCNLAASPQPTCTSGLGNNSACGGNGVTCAACGGFAPTCTNGTCTGACGSPGNGQCGSSCCIGGVCQAWSTARCGPSCLPCGNCKPGFTMPVCTLGHCSCRPL